MGEEEEEGGVGAAAFSPLHPFLPDPLNCGLRVPCGVERRGGGEKLVRSG